MSAYLSPLNQLAELILPLTFENFLSVDRGSEVDVVVVVVAMVRVEPSLKFKLARDDRFTGVSD